MQTEKETSAADVEKEKEKEEEEAHDDPPDTYHPSPTAQRTRPTLG
jgi:hypothetical protein